MEVLLRVVEREAQRHDAIDEQCIGRELVCLLVVIAEVIRDEEESFLRTIDHGLRYFAAAANEARGTGGVIGAAAGVILAIAVILRPEET